MVETAAGTTVRAVIGRRESMLARGRRTNGVPGRVAAALAVALALGACGGSGGDDGDVAAALADPATTPLDVVLPDETDGATGPDAPDGPLDPVELPSADDAASAGDGARTDLPFAVYESAPGVEACSVDDIKARVDFDMRDYYVYADRVPSLSPAGPGSPQALIEALRVDPDVFSSVFDAVEFGDQSAGRTVDFGFDLAPGSEGRIRFGVVIGGSPAAAAGIERGDVLASLDGEPVGRIDELGRAGVDALLERLDGAEEGETLRFGIERGGEALEVGLAKAAYTIDTLAGTFSFTAEDGTRVGYVPVLRFAESTAASLDAAFAQLADDGVEALVLDLRYNPGGLVFTASRLAAHIAGERVAGEVFETFLFNERYAREQNVSFEFERVDATLGLDRVVAIMTGGSASASEAVVNSLRPFIDVEVVGTRSFGKAFGSLPMPYCDVVISAMLFVGANADGETVVGGIEPDCEVEDVWDFPLGDERDALTGAAYGVLLDGVCPSDVQASAGLAARTRAGGALLWDGTPTAPASYLTR